MCQKDNEKRDGGGKMDLSNFLIEEVTILSAEFINKDNRLNFSFKFENDVSKRKKLEIPVEGEGAFPELVRNIYEITGCISEYQLAGKKLNIYYNLLTGRYSFGSCE